MTKRKGEGSFEVGYGKPPQHSQFKRGQSGNPHGRPKGAKGFDASLVRELETKITVIEGGVCKTVSKAEAAAKRLVEKALKSDIRAIHYLAEIDRSFAQKVEARIKLAEAEEKSLAMDPGDEEILRHYANHVREEARLTASEGGDA